MHCRIQRDYLRSCLQKKNKQKKRGGLVVSEDGWSVRLFTALFTTVVAISHRRGQKCDFWYACAWKIDKKNCIKNNRSMNVHFVYNSPLLRGVMASAPPAPPP